MRYRFILFMLLFSIFFNVVHDMVISIESKDKCPINIQIIEETMPNSQCNDISSLHHFFHLFAIFNKFDIQFLKRGKHPLRGSLTIWISYLKNSIFRPPIL